MYYNNMLIAWLTIIAQAHNIMHSTWCLIIAQRISAARKSLAGSQHVRGADVS